jgi:hypothetical protein
MKSEHDVLTAVAAERLAAARPFHISRSKKREGIESLLFMRLRLSDRIPLDEDDKQWIADFARKDTRHEGRMALLYASTLGITDVKSDDTELYIERLRHGPPIGVPALPVLRVERNLKDELK